MRTLGLALTLMLVVVAAGHGGPNEHGALNIHGNVDGVETNGDPCTSFPIPDNCWDLVNAAQPDANGIVWFVVVVARGAPYEMSFNTVTFGIGDYDSEACNMVAHGPCIPEGMSVQEIPSEGWPGPNTGTSVSWAPDCRESYVVPVYYFGFYAYGGGGWLSLADEYPNQDAAFVSCESPPTEDPINGYGEFHCGGDAGDVFPLCPPYPTQKTTWGQIKGIYR